MRSARESTFPPVNSTAPARLWENPERCLRTFFSSRVVLISRTFQWWWFGFFLLRTTTNSKNISNLSSLPKNSCRHFSSFGDAKNKLFVANFAQAHQSPLTQRTKRSQTTIATTFGKLQNILTKRTAKKEHSFSSNLLSTWRILKIG